MRGHLAIIGLILMAGSAGVLAAMYWSRPVGICVALFIGGAGLFYDAMKEDT